MTWDDLTLGVLAAFGCLTLLLTQISEVLSKLPQVIRAWRRVRQELRGGTGASCEDDAAGAGERGPRPH
ncbi:hypothetical protein [Streptomyces murinus]|uniref:Uncharacterized protein n=1 Tax=Streptomyces murinus TaxID=33900 RepID=A0A7W3NMJ3_STRMR|nr:hypothetical protein [Streptomyces murinus]MBA9053228.1 hypothetical protein [Streptomyces murinus]UWW94383.1 hypothetical protein GO605_28735 [Streptomyces murinus]